MNHKKIKPIFRSILILGLALALNGCSNSTKKVNSENAQKAVYASEVIPFFNDWNLILGDGSNVGEALNYEHKDFFYTSKDGEDNWVVFKTPNAGNTHGSSNNTRTELAQKKKWYPKTADDKLNARLKVMNVSTTGDARVAASYSVVVGQIHSADGHENEPLKIFYKKFPGHSKGSVFWHYEINTQGDNNSGRWDYSTPVWGYDFSVLGDDEKAYPKEPDDGIALGEEFSYEIAVKDGMMQLTFSSEGHETKTFTKNLIESEYTTLADIPEQTQGLFVPIGQDGVEHENAYAGEGCFFKLGCYNQTNGKSPDVNGVWCSGAETFDGDIQKQYESGNYAEVWFKTASIKVSDAAVSNSGYFTKNDDFKKTTEFKFPSDVIPFMDEFKILLGDGTSNDDLVNYKKDNFFYVDSDGERDWVVYKTPNSGVTSRTSSNTRTELGQKEHWIPEKGGKLTGTCKVMHVSTSGDARVAASYSVVIGQIHSDEGHENEPLKIYYKKFPGHTKGSVFWNYEINTAGEDNSGRWDYSTAVWGHDFSVVGASPTDYPEEPKNGVELGETFFYEVNVFEGIMYLTFKRDGHETVQFTKDLLKSDFPTSADIPQQIRTLYAAIGRDGVERKNAYAGEIQYFKQGAYNQTNGKNPEDNIVWYTGADVYNGDIGKQYANGDYAEVWFREATVGPGTSPNQN